MTKAPRCRFCDARVEFFTSPFTGRARKFDATPIDGHSEACVNAFPVLSERAYKFVELVAIVQVQRECSTPDAEAEVRDMPWYRPHDCPNSPFRTDAAPGRRTND